MFEMMMFTWDEKWAKRRAENIIVEYVRGIEGRTIELTLREIRSLLDKGLTEKNLMGIISKIEKSPLYYPLQEEACKRRLDDLKEEIKEILHDNLTH